MPVVLQQHAYSCLHRELVHLPLTFTLLNVTASLCNGTVETVEVKIVALTCTMIQTGTGLTLIFIFKSVKTRDHLLNWGTWLQRFQTLQAEIIVQRLGKEWMDTRVATAVLQLLAAVLWSPNHLTLNRDNPFSSFYRIANVQNLCLSGPQNYRGPRCQNCLLD